VKDFVPQTPGRLYTWVDVDERLSEFALADRWPTWLLEADSWWDNVKLTVSEAATTDEIHAQLEDWFGPGSVLTVGETQSLVLDGPRGSSASSLPIEIVRSAELTDIQRLPRLRERRITRALSDPLPRPDREQFLSGVQVLAFHSFKGGVGRTVHAVAIADHLARQGSRVLLVDADLEAPGITWMHKTQGGQMDFSYEDFLAALHGSPDGSNTPAITLASSYLPNQEAGRYVGGGSVIVLPASRRHLLTPPRIDPGDLLTPERSRYFVSEALAGLASSVNADTVVIDLRAGSSELSAPLLLDPRVQRVFVTSLSSQSLMGTIQLIQQLGLRAPARQGVDPVSAAVITQFRHDTHRDQVDQACSQLSEALSTSIVVSEDNSDPIETEVLTKPLLSPFHDDLLALPTQWDDVIKAIHRSGLGPVLSALAPVPPDQMSLSTEARQDDIHAQRERLSKAANQLVYAEQEGLTSSTGFLATEPLRRLAGDHRTEPPVALVLGAKGSGKTFTYTKACAARSWREFALQSDVTGVTVDAPIVPVLEPASLQEDETVLTTHMLRHDFANRHGGTATTTIAIQDELNRGLANLSAEDTVSWRALWLRCLAMAAGLTLTDSSPEDALVELGMKTNCVFVIDGLEDLLQALDSEVKRTALRTLLIETLSWLRALRGRPLGIVVFVRRDLVTWAVRQNSGQLIDRYKSYELRWDSTDALRLTVWVSVQAEILEQPSQAVADISGDDSAQMLIPLWGWKMGSAKSREARSHLWVPAALADFNGQVQARDVMVFLAESAQLSQGTREARWSDRVLTPAAMRNSLERCSRMKIEAIQTENKEIGGLLARLERLRTSVSVPFNLEEVDLTSDEAESLLRAGVFFLDASSGQYRVPEIYRHGLGFTMKRRARVLNN
jgi:MinD-like ATPase involved in chromosome partitioning or flagellar assembly